MKTVDQLMNEAFGTTRSYRSPEYKAGVRAVLEYRINRKEFHIPFPAGTAQSDAFYSGADEGRAIWRRLLADTQA